MVKKFIKTVKVILIGIGIYISVIAVTPIIQLIGLIRYVKRSIKLIWY